MKLSQIREMVGSIIDYDPNIVSYRNQVNRMINETYLDFMSLHPWPFSQATLDDFTLPDISFTGLSTTATTGAPEKHINLSGAGIPYRYRGCHVQISGCADNDDNGEYIITQITLNGLRIHLEKQVGGRQQPQWNDQWMGWQSSNAGTVICKIMQRYLFLPMDCDYPMAINIRNPIKNGTAGYRAMYQLTRRRDEELNLKLDLVGAPTDWVAYDTAPEKIGEIQTKEFVPLKSDLTITDYGVASNFWPQGDYEFKYAYVYDGVVGPLSDPIAHTVTLANANLRFTTRDTTLAHFRGLNKRIYMRMKSVTVGAVTYSDELFRDISAWTYDDNNMSSSGFAAPFIEILDDDTSFDWPNTLFVPDLERFKSLPRAPENEGRCWRVRLFPRPAGTTGNDLGLPIRLRYVQQPQRLTVDDDTPLSPPDTHRYIVYRTCEELFQKFNNVAQAEFYRRKADRELLRIEQKHLQTHQGPNIKTGYRNGPVWTKPFVTLTHT